MDHYLGLDIGGSHISIGIITSYENKRKQLQAKDISIDTSLPSESILESVSDSVIQLLNEQEVTHLEGIGIAVPGPFLYDKGVSKIYHQNKYDHLFGLDFKHSLLNRLNPELSLNCSGVSFINDAQAFLLGAVKEHHWGAGARVLGITLGTGLGSAFSEKEQLKTQDVPNDGVLYNASFRTGIAEDYLSAKWLVNRYKELSNGADPGTGNVKELSDRYTEDQHVRQVFHEFGSSLGEFLAPALDDFDADCLVLGGNISKAYQHFEEAFLKRLSVSNGGVEIRIVKDTSRCAVLGAVEHAIGRKEQSAGRNPFRKSVNAVLPAEKTEASAQNCYDIYPSYSIGEKKINSGFGGLAQFIKEQSRVVIDGYVGVDWEGFASRLNAELIKRGVKAQWYCSDAALKDEAEIQEMLLPFLGGKDPVFGHRYQGDLRDFFDEEKLSYLQPESETACIIYGCGAHFAAPEAPHIYVDVPKNEIQYRSRAGNVCNIGSTEPLPPKEQYKRFYFIDWVVLNKHKKWLLPGLDIIVDAQRADEITWMEGDEFREALNSVTRNIFRLRPWFEPGVWGGQWIKDHVKGLSKDAINYAWSFECIVPENGIVLQSDSRLLEVSFDFLMYHDNKAVLGKSAEIFGDEFPIRFDFLDTVEGENLSLQCHPSNEYIKKHFGEKFTQDETYYILDATDDAQVLLGFQDDIDPNQFREVLTDSQANGTPVPVQDYVQYFSSARHDFFLIPAGTVHCSGKGNMVLEISSTPYIYTFKMYDWLRLDLDGNPRPINIDRAFDNLNFERKGRNVEKELVSKPKVISQGRDWELIHLPTHDEHFYDVHRIEFEGTMEVPTDGHFHILNLVEGSSIAVKTSEREQEIHYAETFVIPAAAKSYTLVNKGNARAKVVKAFVKDEVHVP